MRLSVLLGAAALLSVSCLPVLALDADQAAEIYENAELSEEADIALWCGAAYLVAAEQVKAEDAAGAATMETTGAALIEKADALMQKEGLAIEDVRNIQEAYGFQVAVQILTTPDDTDYTQEECGAVTAE